MPTRRLLRLLSAPVLVLTLGLAVAACGSDSPTPSAGGGATTAPAAPEVVAKDFSFTLAGSTVTPGATVRFRNDDQADHTMTADGGAFDTGHVAPGKEAEIHAPTAPGTYAFHCEIHPSMTATLTVR